MAKNGFILLAGAGSGIVGQRGRRGWEGFQGGHGGGEPLHLQIDHSMVCVKPKHSISHKTLKLNGKKNDKSKLTFQTDPVLTR